MLSVHLAIRENCSIIRERNVVYPISKRCTLVSFCFIRKGLHAYYFIKGGSFCMNGLYLVIISALVFVLAYRFYGAFIAAKVLTLNQYKVTLSIVR